MNTQKLSFIIPAKDEEATIKTLFQKIKTEVNALEQELEVIFIDDGSTDGTWEEMEALSETFQYEVRAIRMRTNIGKSRALAAGFKAATGDIVFTMDADLQDDPVEIPRFLEKLAKGYDIVSGYKQTRHDPWHKVLPSRVFNKMVSTLNGVVLHDHNCGFKCYRAEVLKTLRLHGEMHRMIPCLASIDGYRSGEIVVKHHPRQFGVSKYGVQRFARGFFDMTTVYFIKNYKDRPMHFFGGLGAILELIGLTSMIAGILMAFLSLPNAGAIITGSFALIAAGPIMVAMGFSTELRISGKGGEIGSPISTDSRIMPRFRGSNILKFPSKKKRRNTAIHSPKKTPSSIHALEDSPLTPHPSPFQ